MAAELWDKILSYTLFQGTDLMQVHVAGTCNYLRNHPNSKP